MVWRTVRPARIHAVDTPGAYPGQGARRKLAIRKLLRDRPRNVCRRQSAISVIIGEGGSGVLCLCHGEPLSHAETLGLFLISPEVCASNPVKDSEKSVIEAPKPLRHPQDSRKLVFADRVSLTRGGGASRQTRQHQGGWTRSPLCCRVD